MHAESHAKTITDVGHPACHEKLKFQRLVSCIMQDGAHAITSSYLMLNLLLCGFYLRIPNMTLSFYKGLTWGTFAKYTFQGLAINELKNRQWDLSSCSQTNPGGHQDHSLLMPAQPA